jgi:hypothetical protein
MTIIGGDNVLLPSVTKIPGGRIEIGGEEIGTKVRDALDRVRIVTDGAFQGAMAGLGRGFMFGNRVSW